MSLESIDFHRAKGSSNVLKYTDVRLIGYESRVPELCHFVTGAILTSCITYYGGDTQTYNAHHANEDNHETAHHYPKP